MDAFHQVRMIYLNLVYYFFPDHFSYKIYIGQIHFSLFIEKWHFIILFFSENAGKLFLKNIRLFFFRQILSKFHPFHPAGEVPCWFWFLGYFEHLTRMLLEYFSTERQYSLRTLLLIYIPYFNFVFGFGVCLTDIFSIWDTWHIFPWYPSSV